MQNLELTLVDLPPLSERLWKCIDSLPISKEEKQVLHYKIVTIAFDEIMLKEEEYKQLYYPTY